MLEIAPTIGHQHGLVVANTVIQVPKYDDTILIPLYNYTDTAMALSLGTITDIAEYILEESVLQIDAVGCAATEREAPRNVSQEGQSTGCSDVSAKLERPEGVPRDQLLAIKGLVNKWAFIFAHSDCQLGGTDRVQMRINTQGHKPIKQSHTGCHTYKDPWWNNT